MIQLRFANQTRVREFFRYAPVLASIVLCHTVAAAQTDPEVPQSEEQLRLDVQDVVYVRPLGDPGAWTHIASELASDPSSDHPALVMNTAPGVNIQMNSGQEHLVSIRSPVLTGGAGQGSFLVLIDGVPTRAPAFRAATPVLSAGWFRHHPVFFPFACMFSRRRRTPGCATACA